MIEVIEMKTWNIEIANGGLLEHESGKTWRRTVNKNKRYGELETVCRQSSPIKWIEKTD